MTKKAGERSVIERTDRRSLRTHRRPFRFSKIHQRGGGEQNKTNDGENPTWKEQWMGEWMRIDPTN